MRFETLTLPFTRSHHPGTNLRGSFGCRAAAQFLVLHRRHFNMDINPIEQWA